MGLGGPAVLGIGFGYKDENCVGDGRNLEFRVVACSALSG